MSRTQPPSAVLGQHGRRRANKKRVDQEGVVVRAPPKTRTRAEDEAILRKAVEETARLNREAIRKEEEERAERRKRKAAAA